MIHNETDGRTDWSGKAAVQAAQLARRPSRHVSRVVRVSKFAPPRSLFVLSGVAALLSVASAGSASTTTTGVNGGLQSQPGSLSQTFGRDRRRLMHVSIASALAEIRRRAALRWDQLASIFGVSRRAVHLWASGGGVGADNAEKVLTLHREIEDLHALSPVQARDQILRRYDVAQSEARPLRPVINPGAILEADQSSIGDGPQLLRARSQSGRRLS